MELDLTTIILELVNFLILIWLLKHFLYQPVLNAINARQQTIAKTIQDAESIRVESERVQANYKNRLSALEEEQASARHLLSEELEALRSKALTEIKVDIKKEEDKALNSRLNQEAHWRHEVEQQALIIAARFASLVLKEVSDVALQDKLLTMAIDHLTRLNEKEINHLSSQLTNHSSTIEAISAYPLSPETRLALEKSLSCFLGDFGKIEYREEIDLIAGLRLSVGNWSLGLSLADELKGFTECIHEQRP